jgi:aryl-alcohol dehydrogenase-like predicted oxidoreductase
MDYRFLGRSGLQVSRLSCGTMSFGGGDDFKHIGDLSLLEAKRIVDLCIEAGVNLFDTADYYSQGASEEMLGKAIGSQRRDQVLIATKAFYKMGPGLHDVGLSRRHLIAACEASLKRLKTDYIDLYQLHLFDSFTPLEETLSALEYLLQQGKIRYVGCSNFAGWQLMKALATAEKHNYQPLISQQIYYSLIARESEHELMPLSLDQKVGVLIWSPLSFGLLSGKYRRDRPRPETSRLAFMDPPGTIDWERLYRIVDLLEEIAQARGKTIPQVVLNWLLCRPAVSSVIVGARNEEQLKENLGAVGWSLTEEEVRQLEKESDLPEPYPYWHQHSWGEKRNPSPEREYCVQV